jgi:hypothetical protein
VNFFIESCSRVVETVRDELTFARWRRASAISHDDADDLSKLPLVETAFPEHACAPIAH